MGAVRNDKTNSLCLIPILSQLQSWTTVSNRFHHSSTLDDETSFLLCIHFVSVHSYIISENLLTRFCKGNLPCLQCKVKALAMPSFWPEGIDNAFILSKNQCECLSFWPEGIANAFLFTLDGKFSLTIGMIMPLGWGEVTGIIPKLVTQGPFRFPTCDTWRIQMGFCDSLGIIGKSPCLRLSLKASRHCF